MANTVVDTEIKESRLRLADGATQKIELRPPNPGKEITDSLPTVQSRSVFLMPTCSAVLQNNRFQISCQTDKGLNRTRRIKDC